MNNRDFEELKKKVSIANQRMDKIEKVYGKKSWGTKKVYDKFENNLEHLLTKNGRISIKKSYSDFELRAINRITTNFLKSKSTSTLIGVRNLIKNVKKGISDTLDVDAKEAEVLYNTFFDDTLKWLFQYIEPSDAWALIEESNIKGFSKDRFIKEIDNIVDVDRLNQKNKLSKKYLQKISFNINDLDIKEKLSAIYDRYVI